MEYEKSLFNVYEKTVEDYLIPRSRGHGNNSPRSNRNFETPDDNFDEHFIPFLFPTFRPSSLSWNRSVSGIRSFILNTVFNRNCNMLSRLTAHDQGDNHSEVEGALNNDELEMYTIRGSSSSINDGSSTGNVSPTSHFSSGLRRRPNSVSPRRLETSLPLSSSLDIPFNISLSDENSEENMNDTSFDEDGTGIASIPSAPSNHLVAGLLTTPHSATTELARNAAIEQLDQSGGHAATTTNSSSRGVNSLNHSDNSPHREPRTSSRVSNYYVLLIFIMRVLFLIAVIFLCILTTLHFTYVGSRINKLFPGEPYEMNCLERVLLSRSEAEGQLKILSDETIYKDGSVLILPDPINRKDKHDRTPSLLGVNEILQLKIIYGRNDCKEGQCSKVRYVHNSKVPKTEIKNKDKGEEEIITDYDSSEYWTTPDYRFSVDKQLLQLDPSLLSWYDVSIVNVTVTESCLMFGKDGLPQSKLQIFTQRLARVLEMDAVIVNQFMHGIKNHKGEYRHGHLQNMMTKEKWSYVPPYFYFYLYSQNKLLSGAKFKVMSKVSALIGSLWSYILLTSVTALIVRVLTSSGILILQPMLSLFRFFGVNLDLQMLYYSHPWLGSTRRQIERRGLHLMSHFVCAHLFRLFLLYGMYEACQATWSLYLYDPAMAPDELSVIIFSLVLMMEYFSLIYVRSALSAYFYPRYGFLLFVGYHLYYYSCPYGFFRVAIIPYILMTAHVSIFILLALEAPAHAKGAISSECPREVYVKLSWNEWSASLPSEFTMFLPLNARYIPIHDRNYDDDDNQSNNNEITSDVESG